MTEKSAGVPKSGDIGAWEKHTKGFGLKLLQKFGFKGRLGANENGVSRAIEVVVRPGNTGLGFGDVQEASTLKVNKKIEAEWRGVEYVEEEDEKKHKKSSVEKLADGKGWKKNKALDKSNTVTKLNATDFINKYMNDDILTKPQQVIIDMRHKDTRVITDMTEVGTEGYTEDGISTPSKPKLGQELLYNINIIANTEEMNVTKDSKALAHTVMKQKTLSSDKIILEKNIQNENSRLERLNKIQLILTRIYNKINIATNSNNKDLLNNNPKNDVTIVSICTLMRTLYEQFPEEFQIFGFIHLLSNLLTRTLVETVNNFQPLNDYKVLLDLYDSIQPLYEYFIEKNEVLLAKQVNISLIHIIEAYYLPIIHRYISSNWNVITETSECVQLFHTLQLILTKDVFSHTVDMYLLPKLTSFLNNWRVSIQNPLTAAHIWIHPWLPILTTKLTTLYPEIRRKFSSFFSTMSIEYTEVIVNMLLPWVNVFDQSSFETLLCRSVLPKLVSSLREIQINPNNQENISIIQCILYWTQLIPSIPTVHIVYLWVGEFFPKWLRVLYTWLYSDDVDFYEVSIWYSGWKGLFPVLLVEDVRVTECFALALELMEACLDGDDLSRFLGRLEALESEDYYSLIEQYKTVQRAQRRLEVLQAETNQAYSIPTTGTTTATSVGISGMPISNKYKQQVTYKEVVENFAMRNNIEFTPKIGRFYEGKQLWNFGKNLCFLEQNVVFVATAGDKAGKRTATDGSSGSTAAGMDQASRQELYGWTPIALEDLLEMSQ